MGSTTSCLRVTNVSNRTKSIRHARTLTAVDSDKCKRVKVQRYKSETEDGRSLFMHRKALTQNEYYHSIKSVRNRFQSRPRRAGRYLEVKDIPTSSWHSRTAACSSVSPASCLPPGKAMCPLHLSLNVPRCDCVAWNDTRGRKTEAERWEAASRVTCWAQALVSFDTTRKFLALSLKLQRELDKVTGMLRIF